MFGSKDLLFTSEKYGVVKSLRFRSSASAYLSRTFGTPTNNKIFTWSGWVKRGSLPAASSLTLMGAGTTGSNYCFFGFSSNNLYFQQNESGVSKIEATTSAVYRDASSWYHIVLTVDTTQATNSNGLKIYVNNVQQTLTFTSYTQNNNPFINSARANYIGTYSDTLGLYFDGYLAEVNFIDGQALTPSSFGFYDNNGIWQPQGYTGTYGTNGFYLKFTDVGATSGANSGYGKDFSGFNTNYWATNNFGTTSTTSTYDSMYDSPVNASNGITGIGNYAVLNPLRNAATLSNGNLTIQATTTPWFSSASTIGISSGKWYFEGVPNTATYVCIGVVTADISTTDVYSGPIQGWLYDARGYVITPTSSSTTYGATYGNGDVIGVAFDLDVGSITFYKNGVSQTTTSDSWFLGKTLFAWASVHTSGTSWQMNFGQRPFAYTPPSGYSALNTQNLPAPTITNGASNMAAVLYTGTGSSQTITASSTNSGNNPLGMTFQPDFVWVKSRSNAQDHKLTDVVRGTTKALISNTTGAETTDTNGLTAFTSSGFTIGSDATYNTNTYTYGAWEWKAGGTGVSNTSGSITSTVSANTSAGFSVVTWTGNGTTGTVGHGLGVAPSLIIMKRRDTGGAGSNWVVYSASAPLDFTTYPEWLYLNLTSAFQTSASSANYPWSQRPSSTLFYMNTGTSEATNVNNATYVAYCFAPVAGYSAFGSYTGNGSADGPFVYTGFRPRYVLFRNVSGSWDWVIFDTSRYLYNSMNNALRPNTNAAEDSGWSNAVDILSNGFKLRANYGSLNTSANTMIYAAFAENPFNISRAR